MTDEERSELKQLYWLMVEYFERVDIFKDKSELEKLALEISTRGMQTIGAILGKKQMSDCCKDCLYHYELTEEQKQNYDGHCGCESIETTGRCWKADLSEDEW